MTQEEFIRILIAEREMTANAREEALKRLDAGEVKGRLASAWIDRLKTLPRAKRVHAEPDAGMYRRPDGSIMRVYFGQTNAVMLAKRLVNKGIPHPDDPQATLHEWEYLGRANRFMAGAEALSLDAAKEYGKMTRTCCVCARRLDVPESVELGIGPVCGRKYHDMAKEAKAKLAKARA